MNTTDIFQLIAEHVDDPVTFRRFACASKKCAQACKLLVPTKQIQFSKRQCTTEFLGCPCCDGLETIVWYELPNGQKHGKKKHYNNSDDLYYVEGYSNGIKLYAYNVENPDDFS